MLGTLEHALGTLGALEHALGTLEGHIGCAGACTGDTGMCNKHSAQGLGRGIGLGAPCVY